MGDNKEFNDSAIFWGVLLIVDRGKLQNIEDSSLVILGYQLLPLATSKLTDDYKEFNDSVICWGVLHIVGGGKLQNIEDSSLVILAYQLLSLAISHSMQKFNHILMVLPFNLVWDRTVIVHTSHQSEILHSLNFKFLSFSEFAEFNKRKNPVYFSWFCLGVKSNSCKAYSCL